MNTTDDLRALSASDLFCLSVDRSYFWQSSKHILDMMYQLIATIGLQICCPEAIHIPKEFWHVGHVFEVFENHAALARNVIDDRIIVFGDIGVPVKPAAPISQPATKGDDPVPPVPSAITTLREVMREIPSGEGTHKRGKKPTPKVIHKTWFDLTWFVVGWVLGGWLVLMFDRYDWRKRCLWAFRRAILWVGRRMCFRWQNAMAQTRPTK